MSRQPDFDQFSALARQYDLVPVWRQLFSDSFTAVTACAALDDGGPTALFESVVGGTRVGRYSFLCVGPHRLIEARGRTVTWTDETGVRTADVANPLDVVRQEVTARRAAPVDHLSPFVGGAVGYAGYDVIRYIEHLPNPPADDRNLPDMMFGLFDQIVIFDNVAKTMTVVALVETRDRDGQKIDPEQAYQTGSERVDRIVERLSSGPSGARCIDVVTHQIPERPIAELESNMTREQYEDAVRKAVEYIYAGDIFQVVLSQRFACQLTVDPFDVYRALRVINPSPFMFYLRMPSVTLVGSSPEVMCRVYDNQVTVRPLAGTRRRGETEDEDQRLSEELLADPKERAEHVMLVDLGRNDVGRVARFGSVKLPDVMTVERYSHVMHISSTVIGEMAEGKDAFDAMAAALPAGTVSGAPKVRAMEIIDELEPTRRGPYAGAVGYFDYRGNMDTCIALRTMVCQEGRAWVQAGAGIVADSVPEAEYQETVNKARGLLRAIDLAERAFADSDHEAAPTV